MAVAKRRPVAAGGTGEGASMMKRLSVYVSGIPFFQDAGRVKLELLENRSIAGGCVYLMYRVAGRKA